MDKQILFYSDEYQFYYSPKNKTISSPQISGKQNDDYTKNGVICFGLVIAYWISMPFILLFLLTTNIFIATLIAAIMCIITKIFFKAKTYFNFSLRWVWYVGFAPFYYFWGIVILFVLALEGIEINIALPIYVLLFTVSGVVITYKKSIKTLENDEYIDSCENKKMLREVLMSNDVNYKGIIILEVIGVGICLFYSVTYSVLIFVPFLPIFIVAGFQKNIYYLFLIRKIAKQYGISLKSKDVIAENDEETENQINEEKEITSQADIEKNIEIENKTDIENKTNLEINTQINTEKK